MRYVFLNTGSLLLLLALTACGGNPDPAPNATQPETGHPTASVPTSSPSVTTPSTNPTSGTPTAATPPPASAAPTATGDNPPVTTDQVVIPGERVGPITATTSRQDLADFYGEPALEDAPIHVGEGFTEPGTIIHLGPENSLSVVWQDQSQAHPLYVTDFGPAWKTPEGLGVGISFSTLKQVLGHFQFYGFAWDYEGSLVLEGSNLDQYYGNLLLNIRPSQKSAADNPEAYQQVIGDSLFSSDDPNLKPLDIEVYKMTVYLNPLPK